MSNEQRSAPVPSRSVGSHHYEQMYLEDTRLGKALIGTHWLNFYEYSKISAEPFCVTFPVL